MVVIFLALGDNRRRGVVQESAEVAANGDRVVVLIGRGSRWRAESFAPGVAVVDVARLDLRHPPRFIEEMLLFAGPRFLLHRVVGRVRPFRELARRLAGAYRKRVAAPVHRALFLPVYRRLWPDMRLRLIERHVLRDLAPDLVVVSDPLSMPTAVELFGAHAARVGDPPQLCFSIDHAALLRG
jgi:hypothetical protein